MVYGTAFSQTGNTSKAAGFRASRILSNYPGNKFPEPDYWEYVANKMGEKLQGYQPAGLWIVSLYLSDPEGTTLLSFPSPNGKVYDYVKFSSSDQNERYLNHFDTTGVKVWLQVESGGADIDTLINLVLNEYKHHECVVGFGVDVEWYQTYNYPGGRKVTDEEVQRWETNVKAVDSSYTLFLKHYSQLWMPPTYRGNIIFIDDSQDFNWYPDPFDGLLTEFKNWGQKFYPNPVGFQFGYKLDQNWWSELSDPPKEIGDKLIQTIPNAAGIFWVDFTVTQVFPTGVDDIKNLPGEFSLAQNYPNPFNPTTKITFTIPEQGRVTLDVFNILGQKIKVLIDSYKNTGTYILDFNAEDLSAGIYLYRLSTNNYTTAKKMILIK
jgi:hypothetical protein